MKIQAPMEVERDLTTFAQPRISFTQATRTRFMWRDQVHTVGTCDLATLTEFLVHYAVCARLPAYQLNELKQLLGYGDLGRWQSIDTLLTYGVRLPLAVV